MNSERDIVQERLEEKRKLDKAGKHITKLFMLSSSLIFITLLMVWLIQSLPDLIIPSIYDTATVLIIISSIIIVLAQVRINEDEISKAYRLTFIGLVFGSIFCLLQLIGWQDMLSSNLTYKNILFPFALLHFVHVLVGLGLLIYLIFKIMDYKVHSKSKQFAYNIFLFWHFLGAIWLVFYSLG